MIELMLDADFILKIIVRYLKENIFVISLYFLYVIFMFELFTYLIQKYNNFRILTEKIKFRNTWRFIFSKQFALK